MDMTMCTKQLPAAMIITDFVSGEEKCNYEKYMLELLNHSTWFANKYPGGFIHPNSESNGECDAINEYYEIDFKLLESKTSLMAVSLFSHQIQKMSDGVVAYGICRKPNSSIQATNLHVAFRNITAEDIDSIKLNPPKSVGIQNDIYTVLHTLEKHKNLLLFFPYEFYFTKSHTTDDAIASIADGLYNDFQQAFLFRKNYAKEYDTFITCLYDNAFLIFILCNDSLILCDIVKTEETKTFLDLEDYREW